MLKIKAVNPESGGQGEYVRALYIQRELENLGMMVTRYDIPDSRVPDSVRVNLISVIEGRDTSRTLWFVVHLDTVPEGSRELWATDPYDPVVKDGKIFGRGSEDNGQAVVSTFFTLKALKVNGAKPPLNVGGVFVSDEEVGSKFGVIALIEKSVFGQRDMVVAPDSGEPDGSVIEVAEKSIVWLKLITKGKQVHASTPEKGLNAHRVGLKLALQLDELLHSKYAEKNPLFDPPVSTFEPTKHELNVDNVNTVPGADVQYFDCRMLPQYSIKDVLRDIEAVKSRLEEETGAQIRIEPIQLEENAAPTPPDSEVVQKLRAAIKKLTGIDAKAKGIGGGTVGLYFRRKGIHTAVWSTIDDLAHQPNEYCKIDNIVNDAKVFVHVAMS
jgi:succinyl-diaminopimelate desuccinylase